MAIERSAASKGEHVGPDRLLLTTRGARATVDVRAGGRLASLVVDGHELLVTEGPDAFSWGIFPMAPFAGRLRNATFRFRGRSWHVPADRPPHAIHGLVATRPWRVDEAGTISIGLGAPWPFAGRLSQSFELSPGQLGFRLALEADEPMPATIGWHPWFLRQPRSSGRGFAGSARPGPLELDFAARSMYLRDAEGIATARLVTPRPPPWDDCFTDLLRPPTLRWPGYLELTLESSCAEWVVFDEPAHAICVEPQTGPPDGPNLRPQVIGPGQPLVAEMRWRWRSLAA